MGAHSVGTERLSTGGLMRHRLYILIGRVANSVVEVWPITINKDGPLATIVRQCECGPIAAGLVPRGNSREPPAQVHEDSANADSRGLPANFV